MNFYILLLSGIDLLILQPRIWRPYAAANHAYSAKNSARE